MGTYCAIHVRVSESDSLVAELERYLAETHRGQVIRRTVAQSLGQLYGDEFLCSEKEPPTKVALVSEQPGWVTAHYNSFLLPRELAESLSGRLRTVVITVIAQTCSSAYLVGVWEWGQHLRTLEFADGSWITQKGAPLPFESEPLGENIAPAGAAPWYVFERDSVREYCHHFGLKLWARAGRDGQPVAPAPEFTLLEVLRRRKTPAS